MSHYKTLLEVLSPQAALSKKRAMQRKLATMSPTAKKRYKQETGVSESNYGSYHRMFNLLREAWVPEQEQETRPKSWDTSRHLGGQARKVGKTVIKGPEKLAAEAADKKKSAEKKQKPHSKVHVKKPLPFKA